MNQNNVFVLGIAVIFLFVICSYSNKENFNVGKLNIWVPPNVPDGLKYSSNGLKTLDPQFSSMTNGNVCFPKPGFKYDGIWESKLYNENNKGYRNWNLNNKILKKGEYCGKSPSFQYNKLYFPMKPVVSPPDCPIPLRDIKEFCV